MSWVEVNGYLGPFLKHNLTDAKKIIKNKNLETLRNYLFKDIVALLHHKSTTNHLIGERLMV